MFKGLIEKITEAETYRDAKQAAVKVLDHSIALDDVIESATVLRDTLKALLNVAERTGQPEATITKIEARIARAEGYLTE